MLEQWTRNWALRAIAGELAVRPAGAYLTADLKMIEEAQPQQTPTPGTYASAAWVLAFTLAGKTVPEDTPIRDVLQELAASQRIEVQEVPLGMRRVLLFRNQEGAERGPSIHPRPQDLFREAMRLSMEAARRRAEMWMEPDLFLRLIVDPDVSKSHGYLWRGPDDVCDGRFFNGVRIRASAGEGEGMHWLVPKPGYPLGLD